MKDVMACCNASLISSVLQCLHGDPIWTDVAFRYKSKSEAPFHNSVPQAIFRESNGKGGEERWVHCERCVLELGSVTGLHR